ncbi:hypothetical protein [Mycolicibacterium pyrenivorans]|uniref:hypothetical protein n=1 Tax=Mycolicibacterium pyrenivorans TaxID=187102 RepID=UPI0021F2B566|nr:hypothetical protein [Mycolicibacterium pyrenivorans]MCV7151921.1 hypothetical protein [Mycolicibacterium pyrenivorans]
MRWMWIVSAAVVTVAAVAAAIWLIAEPASPQRKADCAVVEDAAREWQASVETLIPAQGVTGPSDKFVDEQYLKMAAMVHTAADSVSTPEIKQHLNEWATAADRLALSQQDGPGRPEPPRTPEEMLKVFSPINDAAVALGELCPNMPSAQR